MEEEGWEVTCRKEGREDELRNREDFGPVGLLAVADIRSAIGQTPVSFLAVPGVPLRTPQSLLIFDYCWFALCIVLSGKSEQINVLAHNNNLS